MSYGKKQHSRTVDKIHIAARLELANPNLNLGDIARMVGISQSSFSLLRKTKIYGDIKQQYLLGILTPLNNQISDTYKTGRETLNLSVPVALQNLYALALNAKDERVKLKASMEILDREGRHAKVSRIGMAAPEQNVATDEDNEEASSLIAASKATQRATINSQPITQVKQ